MEIAGVILAIAVVAVSFYFMFFSKLSKPFSK